MDLLSLQNQIKRDSEGYQEEFTRQLRHFEHQLDILLLEPNHNQPQFVELIVFLAHVSHCYPEDMSSYPATLMDLLQKYHAVLHPDVRKALAQSLMLLRSKKLVDAIPVLSLFFSLLKCRDKHLRVMLNQYIISDIKSANSKASNNRLNKALQNFMFGMISNSTSARQDENFHVSSGDACDIAAKYSLDICIELYRRSVWRDSKTVSIISEACFSEFNKVMVSALKFFLGQDQEKEDTDDEEIPDVNAMQFRATITKKSRSAKTKFDKAMKVVKRKERKHNRTESFNFSAIHLINDPQGLAEKLFDRLNKASSTQKSKEIKFEIRLMIMNLISRLIGLEKLVLLNFYPYLVRYLRPHQQEVAMILVFCAQATHELISPDAIESLIRTIIDNFVTDSLSSEIIAAGINSIREICSRCPFALTEEMLSYLCTFKVYKDKGVMMATRSLISLYRDVYPELLPKKERGKLAALEVQGGTARRAVFGSSAVNDGIEGAELLPEFESGWEEEANKSEGERDESGWVKVSDDETPRPSKKTMKPVNKAETRRLRSKLHLGLDLHQAGSDEESDDELEYEEETFEASESDEAASEEETLLSDGEEVADSEDSDDDAEELELTKIARPRVETQRILTPADFARLKQLKRESDATKMADPRSKRSRPDNNDENEDENRVSVATIIGHRKKRRSTKEERIESIMEGRKDRPAYGSKKGQKERGSTTNREKTKNKNFLMVVHKRSVVAKKKMSMRDKQVKLRKQIDKEKKSKH